MEKFDGIMCTSLAPRSMLRQRSSAVGSSGGVSKPWEVSKGLYEVDIGTGEVTFHAGVEMDELEEVLGCSVDEMGICDDERRAVRRNELGVGV